MTTQTAIAPFHLAFPVTDLADAREFYVEVLGCQPARSSNRWLDLDFFGHQLVAHLVDESTQATNSSDAGSNVVDGHHVPVPHFGVVLPWETWQRLADRLAAQEIDFEIAPYVRFAGKPGEQATMFFRDPSGNALEFKAFRDPAQMFAVD
ncbi:MAG: VOC family protein [Pirellulaceae bacterium]